MAVEIANVIEAMFSFRGNGLLAPQLLAGAGVIAASLVRTGVGVYTINLEQPLTRDLPAQPAQGHVDCLLAPNIESATDRVVTAELIVGAVPGVFDRVRVNVILGGAASDSTDIPISCIVFRFPSIG